MYTDRQLAIQMEQLLQNYVITERPREPVMMPQLLNDPTEANVRTKLITGSMTETGLRGKFNDYWRALETWIRLLQGRPQVALSARTQAGRAGGNVVGLADKAMYDDAFQQTRIHIGNPSFAVTKAIANQLRFIKHFKR